MQRVSQNTIRHLGKKQRKASVFMETEQGEKTANRRQ